MSYDELCIAADACQLYPPSPYDADGNAKGFRKYDSDKPRMDLVPPKAIREVAEVLTHGAKKYGDHNWRQVDKRTRYAAAAQRHLNSWLSGEDTDPDSGLPHLAHALCSLAMLRECEIEGLGRDDRWKK